MQDTSFAGNVSSTEAYEILVSEQSSKLVDVRTRAEWSYVGLPDLRPIGKEPFCIQWQTFPDGLVSPQFVTELIEKLDADNSPIQPSETALLFLCRSGVRSMSAAVAMTSAGYSRCYNIAGGFEGDIDGQGHRGFVNGWKVSGLPWCQS